MSFALLFDLEPFPVLFKVAAVGFLKDPDLPSAGGATHRSLPL